MIASTSSSASHLAKQIGSTITLPATIMRIPKKTMGPLVKGSLGVTAFDISPDQMGRYVVGGADGQSHIGSLGVGGESEASESKVEAGIDEIERLARRRMKERERERERQGKTYLKGHVGDVRSAKFFPSGQGELTRINECCSSH